MPAEVAATPLVFEAIGTRWQIDSTDPIGASLARAILDRISGFDRTWSRFRSDSVVADIAREAGSQDLGVDSPPLFALYARLADATDGAVSPFVGNALNHLGYDASYSMRERDEPRAGAPDWESTARLEGTVLHTTAPVTIDIGAAGKGYLVDLVAGLLTEAGHTGFTVDASGDIAHRGAPIRVALEHPYDPTRAIGVVTLTGGALCASATNRRAWGDGLHHVIDGRTGSPIEDIVATWALAADTATADGVATALFFSPSADLAVSFAAEGVRVFSDGRIERSPGFGGELFR
ncbi:FAD:protein FMN transferase [Mycetocola miduiensis]|uniref:FAD:protein FMN transferase n=1 Tax=Mycetocola miduiensis TaxID=995034 RepID=A0A1I5BU43_9MICO|nr:FAD:protein FMN transferase [Mycetocola miduiensis]SFN78132.1 thiamine biosynthesis lipoprotein [Mycetocola miduiensis]